MDKTYYYVSIEYNGRSINFSVPLPNDIDIQQFEEKLREEIYISIEKSEN